MHPHADMSNKLDLKVHPLGILIYIVNKVVGQHACCSNAYELQSTMLHEAWGTS